VKERGREGFGARKLQGRRWRRRLLGGRGWRREGLDSISPMQSAKDRCLGRKDSRNPGTGEPPVAFLPVFPALEDFEPALALGGG
jgi:hypothetical protein